MSIRGALIALRAIVRYSSDEQARRTALEGIDELEGLDDEFPPAPPRPKGPMTNAEKCRRKRLRRKGVDPDGDPRATPRDPAATPRDPETTPSDPARGVAAASRDLDLKVSLSPRFQDLKGSRSLDTREGRDPENDPAATPRDPETTPRGPMAASRPAVSASDDGCFGMAVSAWQEGVQAATGRPMTLVRGVVCALVDAIVAHCPAIPEREAWARSKGEAWARQRVSAGLTIKPLDFGDWLTSGEQPPRARVTSSSTETPLERVARKSRDAQREREADAQWRRLQSEVRGVPFTPTRDVGPGVKSASGGRT